MAIIPVIIEAEDTLVIYRENDQIPESATQCRWKPNDKWELPNVNFDILLLKDKRFALVDKDTWTVFVWGGDVWVRTREEIPIYETHILKAIDGKCGDPEWYIKRTKKMCRLIDKGAYYVTEYFEVEI